VAFVLEILGAGGKDLRRTVLSTLKRVQLHHRIDSYPQKLSGGEQQRVAIARALINQPQILLADEPTGNLDPDITDEIMKLFVEINDRGTTVLFATHDRNLIRAYPKRVISLKSGALVSDNEESSGSLELGKNP
jgi:cell division transport system ATP-binding protein